MHPAAHILSLLIDMLFQVCIDPYAHHAFLEWMSPLPAVLTE